MSTTLPGGSRVAGFSTIFWKTHGWEERRWILSCTAGGAAAAGGVFSTSGTVMEKLLTFAGRLASVARFPVIIHQWGASRLRRARIRLPSPPRGEGSQA